MLALYRSGRQAEALEAYRDARAALDELGLEPGAELRRARAADPDPGRGARARARAAAVPGAVPSAAGPARARRRRSRSSAASASSRRCARCSRGPRAARAALVLLAGEAGGGKTRLVRELAHEAAARGVLVLYGASDAAVTTPYQPLREWLEFLLRVGDPDALAECLGAGAEQLARLVPELARVTGAPASSAIPRSTATPLQAAVDRAADAAEPGCSRCCSSPTTSTGPTARRCTCSAASPAPHRRRVCSSSPPTGPRGDPAGELADTLADLGAPRRDDAARARQPRATTEVGAFIAASRRTRRRRRSSSAAIGELTRRHAAAALRAVARAARERRRRGRERRSGSRGRSPSCAARSGRRARRQRLVALRPRRRSRLLELAAVAGPQFELRVLAAAAGLEPRGARAPRSRRRSQRHRRGAARAGAGLPLHPRARPPRRLRPAHAASAAPSSTSGSARRSSAPTHADLDRVLPELAHHFTLAAAVGGAERAVDYNLRAADAAIAAAAFAESAARLSSALELGIADPRERVARARSSSRTCSATRVARRRPSRSWPRASRARPSSASETSWHARSSRAAGWTSGTRRSTSKVSIAIGEEAIETFTGARRRARGLAEAWRLLGTAQGFRGRAAGARAAFEHALAYGRGWGAAVSGRRSRKQLCEGPDARRRGDSALRGADRLDPGRAPRPDCGAGDVLPLRAPRDGRPLRGGARARRTRQPRARRARSRGVVGEPRRDRRGEGAARRPGRRRARAEDEVASRCRLPRRRARPARDGGSVRARHALLRRGPLGRGGAVPRVRRRRRADRLAPAGMLRSVSPRARDSRPSAASSPTRRRSPGTASSSPRTPTC